MPERCHHYPLTIQRCFAVSGVDRPPSSAIHPSVDEPSQKLMCRSKKSTAIIEYPKKISRTPRSGKSPAAEMRRRSSTGDPSLSSSASAVEYESNSSGATNRDWSLSSSLSTHQAALSLSSVMKTLAEDAHMYNFSEISSATGNFPDKRFSSSWRCRLREKEVVVFQRAFRRPIELPELQLRLAAICRSNHMSLIKFLGASISGNYIYLVYEYVQGANLADCLRNARNPNFTILPTWLSRMQIATDLAQGLDYIHYSIGLEMIFVHNHISSANIIVSEPLLNAKICHFGTAALTGEIDDNQKNSNNKSPLHRSGSKVGRIEGTKGYMAPELKATGIANQKTDVYAFGVVILELVSGSEPVTYIIDEDSGSYKTENVIDAARTAMAGGRLRQWVDRRLKDSFPVEIAGKLVRIGLECVDHDPGSRPDMNRVSGYVSRLFLESTDWADKIRIPTGISISLAPR